MGDSRLPDGLVVLMAAGLGLLATAADIAEPLGDDSAKLTIVLWLVFSGLMGLVWPERPWRWALAISPWLPLAYALARVVGIRTWFHPASGLSLLLLYVLSLALCLAGAWAGALVPRALSAGKSGAGTHPLGGQ
jgi:hypothetical protein